MGYPLLRRLHCTNSDGRRCAREDTLRWELPHPARRAVTYLGACCTAAGRAPQVILSDPVAPRRIRARGFESSSLAPTPVSVYGSVVSVTLPSLTAVIL